MPAPIEIIGRNGGATIARATGPKPVCNYCTWAEPETYILAKRRTVVLVCRRYLKGAPNLRQCDLFERATGSDDE
jgi:hypothetical protein